MVRRTTWRGTAAWAGVVAALGALPASAQTAFDEAVEFEVSGRIFARGLADERTDYERRLSLPSARAQVEANFGIARAVIEADIADSELVKDAYVRLAPWDDQARFYAGNFKTPFLGRSTVSRWNLPLVNRGFVEEYLTDTHQLAGRRLGLLGEARPDLPLKPRLSVGVFQGGRDELGQRLGEDLSARVSIKPFKKLEVGVFGYGADAFGTRVRRAAGADLEARFGRLSLMGDALVGRLPVGDFTAQTALVTWLQPLGEVWAVEPVAGAEALQLWTSGDGEGGGTGQNFVAGANLHYGSRLKLMLQGERGVLPGDVGMRSRYLVQLAARF